MDAATARCHRMQVRVYPSLSAHDQDDVRFWAAMPVDERVMQVWNLSEAQWRLRGEFPDASGLPRSVARVYRPQRPVPDRRGRAKDLGDIEALGEAVAKAGNG